MQSRLGPFQILDAQWRRRVWRRWLVSQVTADSIPASPTVTGPAGESASSSPESLASKAATATLQRESDTRRSEARARFDALFDRLSAVEDTLDAFGKRFALRTVHDRRHAQRLLERLEAASEALERQAVALESVTSMVERVEQRVERVERWLRSDGSSRESEMRDSRSAPVNVDSDELDELDYSLSTEPRTGARSISSDAIDAWDIPPFSTSSIRGNLAEMSLPTVLAMLELERRTGVLKVCAEDGSVVSATLRDGSIVGARVRELDSDPVEAIREALRYRTGHFWFRQAGVEIASGPPRSVGAVLLEASRQNDEALRSA